MIVAVIPFYNLKVMILYVQIFPMAHPDREAATPQGTQVEVRPSHVLPQILIRPPFLLS